MQKTQVCASKDVHTLRVFCFFAILFISMTKTLPPKSNAGSRGDSKPKARDQAHNSQDITWKPQPGPQTAFFESPVFELLYGGAAGGGKSEALLFESIALCAKYDKYKAVLFRRTFPELQDSLVPRISSLLYGYARSSDKGMRWTFPNGSVLKLSHLQREDDKEKHKSTEYDYIGFDELTSFSETQYTYLFSRCRGTLDVPRKIRGATNPTGVGHAWVKRRFLTPPPDEAKITGYVEYDYAYGWRYRGRVYTSFNDLPKGYHKGEPAFSREKYPVYTEQKSGLQRAFIPALLWANAALLKNDHEYSSRLKALPEKQQKALLYGNWDVFEGQFFASFNPDVHVIAPFTIPQEYKLYAGVDWGFRAPFSCIWLAVGPDGTVYVYREAYETKLTSTEQAVLILDKTADERVNWFASDPSMHARGHGHGESHADAYQRAGLNLIPSNNAREAGWALIHEALQSEKLKIFSSCTNLIRTLPLLMHHRTKPEDLNTDQEDHAVDALRYAFITLKGAKARIPSHYDSNAEVPDWWYTKVKPKIKTKRAFGYTSAP